MYLSILGKPTDTDLERYPAVHLAGPHEWDPSVLDYTHPSGDVEPPWSNDPDRIPTKKEPCLTPTLLDEGQARNPNTTYNGYKMEFLKFALTWKLICPVQHKITQKEQKETTKKGGISLTIMGQRQTYNSIHRPQHSPNETIGFNQGDHPYRMCNETGIPEFLELKIPEIPMVMMVMSRAVETRSTSSGRCPVFHR